MPTAATRAPVVVTARALSKGFPMGDVIEYVVIKGRRYCACSVAVLEMAEAGFKAAGIIPRSASIHDYVSQGGYRAGATAASKGSHDRGGVVDSWFSLVNTNAKQRIWDQAGAVGCRRYSWEFTSTDTPDHGHIIAVGCPHLAKRAAEQLAEIRKGGDGMAGTRAWTGPTPSFTPWRTRYAAFKAQQEDDMALSTDDKNWIANQIAQVNPWKATYGSPDDTAGSRLSRILLAAEAAASNTRNISRGGNENSPIRQEIADANTNTAALLGLIKGLMAALDTIAGGGLDMAAVEAAAKRGVEAGLAGASVVIDFPKEEQA